MEEKEISEELVEAWDEFVCYLQENQHRITQARRYVFENVMERHDHFCADDVAEELSSGFTRVSRGTVYHTLALMVAANMVREIRGEDMHTHYEHTYGHEPHEHFICKKCKKFYELESTEILTAIKEVSEKAGFEVSGHQVVVRGICKDCLGK